ncbi:MAG: pitrilysin family protein [Candidatus Zixiibacteriota bacterium]
MRTAIIIMCCLLMAVSAFAEIHLPEAKDVKLDNGLTIRVIERHELPLFTLEFCFKAGSIYDPVGREGLANLCNNMLMRGTKSRSAKQIAEEISFGGGTLENYCGRETAGFSGEFLAENGVKGFQVLADILLNSEFANDELIKTRNRILAEIESRFENPSTIATEAFFTAILGDSRYAHIPKGTNEAVTTLSRDDVIEFFHTAYSPENCILIVCGDINKDTVRDWAKKYLGSWRGKNGLADPAGTIKEISGREILILDKPDATQTQIRIGSLGMKRNHPDYVPFETARTVFAGSFTARLINEVRVKRGLTYNIRMRSHGYSPFGLVYVSTFTKNESVGEVLDIILNETDRIRTEAIPEDELTGAINYRTGLYPLNFETNDDIADVYINMWLYDLKRAYYEQFQEQMRKMTPAIVMNATRAFFPYDNYCVVLVGKAEEIASQVEKFGTVTVKPFVE